MDSSHYVASAELFMRLLGMVYVFAFGAFLFQIEGLLGKNGILPIGTYLYLVKARVRYPYYNVPTLFWLNHSDAFIWSVAFLGTCCGVLLLAGVYPPLMLAVLYILYISIVSAGQDFLSFGWEMFLLEVTLNAFFLSWTTIPNPIIWLSLNVLLFRFHFQGGMVKLQSRDRNWRNLTGVAYHYQSQPLPNTIAWYAYRLPLWFQKLSCAVMLIVEIVVPFFIFTTDELRLGVYFAFVGLQFFIWLTGNFSFLNYLTVALCTILIADRYLPYQIIYTETPFGMDLVLTVIGTLLLMAQVINFWNSYLPRLSFLSDLFAYLHPFHIGNRYGIFAIMTTRRIEIVLEGSEDGINWREYLFRYKPSEIERRPRRIAPYQPRLDWQMWFLPFSNYASEGWLQSFCYHLLKGTPPVLRLLRYNPFAEKPPKFVRGLAYEYVFTEPGEKGWWKRIFMGRYTPDLSLRSSSDT